MIRVVFEAPDWLDVVYKLSLASIALFNIGFAVRFFYVRLNRDQKNKESDWKLQMLKALVLDHRFSKYNELILSLELTLNGLKENPLTAEKRSNVNGSVEQCFIDLRLRFYDVLIGVDKSLYQEIRDRCDELQGSLTEVIFHEGRNLSHGPTFSEEITDKLLRFQSDIVRTLYNYRG